MKMVHTFVKFYQNTGSALVPDFSNCIKHIYTFTFHKVDVFQKVKDYRI